MVNDRILWIDQLKCLAIFGVVLSHVYQWSGFEGGIALGVFGRFHTMLFMFLSGYFCIKSSETFTSKSFLQFLKKKTIRIIVPFLVVGSIFALLERHTIIPLLDGSMGHYWFLASVYCCMLLSWLFFAVTKKIKNDKLIIAFAILFSGGAMTLWHLGPLRPIPYSFMTISSLPYFLMGCLYRKYDSIKHLFENDYLYLIAIILAIVFTVYKGPHNMAGFFYIIVFLRLFKTNEKKIGQKIAGIGKWSLEIYILHFFLLPNLSALTPWLTNAENMNGNFIVTISVFSAVSVLIMGVSILMGFVLKGSPKTKWIVGS